jgi:hypothetical protein
MASPRRESQQRQSGSKAWGDTQSAAANTALKANSFSLTGLARILPF